MKISYCEMSLVFWVLYFNKRKPIFLFTYNRCSLEKLIGFTWFEDCSKKDFGYF